MSLLSEFAKFYKDMTFKLYEKKDISRYVKKRFNHGKPTDKQIQKISKILVDEIDKFALGEKETKAFSFSQKQQEFRRNANCRWNIKVGATRSGKTYFDYFQIARRICECEGQGLIVILGNTQGTVTRNILEPMRAIWSDYLIGKISSDGTVKMFGKKVYILGADKVSSVTKIQGAGIEYCYGDEVTTWNEEVFSMLKSRLDKPNSCFDGTCNPDAPQHWFKNFIDSDTDIYTQNYRIYDNKYLSKEFISSLEKEYKGTVYFERFIEGKWAMAEGVIYAMFTEENNVIDYEDPGEGEYYVSIDYGTVNPCSMGLWHIDRPNNRAVRVSEYYYDSKKKLKQLTDEEYYKELEKLCGNRIIQCVIVDPSAASFITTIRNHGKFSVRKAKNDVLDGIRVVATNLNQKKIMINRCCKDSIREFGQYAWDKKANSDAVIKVNDHAMDDIRYFVNTVFKRLF